MAFHAPRAARLQAAVRRVGRRPRRGEFERDRFARLGFALRGRTATVQGLTARVIELVEMVGGVEVSVSVEEGDVSLRLGHDEVRQLLEEADPASKVFGWVDEIVAQETIIVPVAGEGDDEP